MLVLDRRHLKQKLEQKLSASQKQKENKNEWNWKQLSDKLHCWNKNCTAIIVRIEPTNYKFVHGQSCKKINVVKTILFWLLRFVYSPFFS